MRRLSLIALIAGILFAGGGQLVPRAQAPDEAAGDGALGRWTPFNLTTLARDHMAAAHPNGLLLIGGGGETRVYLNRLDGGFDPTQVVGRLAEPRAAGFVVRYLNHYYVLGGGNGLVDNPLIERVTDLGGTSYTVTPVRNLPFTRLNRGGAGLPRTGFAIGVDRFLYLFGAQREVYRAEMMSDGGLGDWIRSADSPGAMVIGAGVAAGALFTQDDTNIIRRTTFAADGTPVGFVSVASSPYSVFFAFGDTIYRGAAPNATGDWEYTDAITLGPWTRMARPSIRSCVNRQPHVLRLNDSIYAWTPCLVDGFAESAAFARIGGLLITGISPRTVSTAGGARVTIGGRNIAPGVTVTLDGVTLTTLSVTAQEILFAAPPSSEGRHTLVVRNPDGEQRVEPFDYATCSFTVSPSTVNVPAAGGTASVAITAAAEDCSWTASTNAPWASVTASGTGGGTATITAQANPTPLARMATASIGGRSITIQQAATTSSGLPGPPSNLTATVSNGTVDLQWAPPTTGVLSHYVLEAGSAPGLTNLAQMPIAATATSLRVAGVPPGAYFVRLRAWGVGGPGGVSNEVIVSVGECSSPPGASSLDIVKLSSTMVRLTWTAAAGRVSSYIVQAGSSTGLANLANFDTGSPDTVLLANAPPGVYFVRVYARNSCGVSPASNEVVLVMP